MAGRGHQRGEGGEVTVVRWTLCERMERMEDVVYSDNDERGDNTDRRGER